MSLTTPYLDELATELLTAVESREARLLNWGFTHVSSRLDEAELRALLVTLPQGTRARWAAAEAAGTTPDELVANLVGRKLLRQGASGYRSRFAEAVRLFYLLRQRFPTTPWQSAPRLVSDVKLHLQRRRYPRRDIPLSNLWTQLAPLALSGTHRRVIERLLTAPDGTSLQLARFQADAVAAQLRNLQQRGDRGIVIGAGTGAGKTKAFYLPAFAHVAADIGPEPYVQVLALYPRIELLKDQLAEAFAEARKLDQVLIGPQKRPLTMGAYYGDTPTSAYWLLETVKKAHQESWTCPYFRCPTPDCAGEAMHWHRADLEREALANQKRKQWGRYERLYCPKCHAEATGAQLYLTRERMLHEPPDLLFTTTEMLNRRLSRSREQPLFGVGARRPPRLVLLDEIHTYEGLAGAQVAYLLRRWRHARGRSREGLCLVGLSATLAEAEQFFSKLTGLAPHQVEYLAPAEGDLVEEGIEYNVVLQGDPVSGTSLLSTSVQSAMLLGRILDPPTSGQAESVSRGAMGQRIFAFTDKLDLINRWYHIEVNAETQLTLSRLRDLDPTWDRDERRRRFEQGEWWEICRYVGHDLGTPLRLDLTSSQHRGVAPDADLVIATSSLEVGFNDPAVGAVLQHKTPRSMASFLQRKGRAGRVRGMRPWMVVVTSAYGRDRWAFQHAEHLFDPLLPPLELPLDNGYVQKIQAAFALMDWLALTAAAPGEAVDVWVLLSSGDLQRSPQHRAGRTRLARLLRAVLEGTRLAEWTSYLAAALGLQDDERAVQQILWGEPRALLLEVIPTLLRQLETDWQRIVGGAARSWQDRVADSPMPDFVPPNLFTDLNLPELTICGTAPTWTTDDEARHPTMALAQGLVEFAPGKVNKRFARRDQLQEAHWLALPPIEQRQGDRVALADLKVEHAGLPGQVEVGGDVYELVRPRAFELETVPTNVKSMSSSRWIWRSHFAPQPAAVTDLDESTAQAAGTALTLEPGSPWAPFLTAQQAYLHGQGHWVVVSRLGVGVEVETYYTGGRRERQTLHFHQDGNPAALGFALNVDALRFDFAPLDPAALMALPTWPRLYARLSAEFFLHQLRQDPRLAEAQLSEFDVQWLWQLELSMVTAIAIARSCGLEEAAAEVQARRLEYADRTLHVIFQSQRHSETSEEVADVGYLHRRLLEYLTLPLVQAALREGERVLWHDGDPALPEWLGRCYASSLGAVVFAALGRFVPDIDPSDLVLDVAGPTIWISEQSLGGVGLVAKLAAAIRQRPREFDLQLLDTVQHCDREQLAVHLRAVVRLLDAQEPALTTAFATLRAERDLPKVAATRQALVRVLEAHGIATTRELSVALNTKLLRPNSGTDSDQLVATLVNRWEQEEARLGQAIDLRVLAVAAPRIPEIQTQVQTVLARIGGDQASDEYQIFNLLQSLLWLDCRNSCPTCIEQWQPYQPLVRPSRALLLALLAPQSASVRYGAPGWESDVQAALERTYQAILRCAPDEAVRCKGDLLRLLTQPVEIGYQLLFPVVERIGRREGDWLISLTIRELVQR